jgi:MoxR-like ATPase
LEFEGTYPLPEAQLDRFLFKLIIDYPPAAAEREMLITAHHGSAQNRPLNPVATVADCLAARREVQSTKVSAPIIDYLLALVQQTRQHADLSLGASPRAAVAWLAASKAAAWLDRRDFVTPDDLKLVATPLLRHRLMLRPEAQLDGLQIDQVITGLVNQVAVPR